MKSTAISAALVAAALTGLTARAEGGLRVEHLGVNNTLVRVDSAARYLMLPVQEAYDDAKVDILVDGHLDRTIFVRLAKSKVDYSMPLDLSPYAGHNVVLNVVNNHSRSSVREPREDACWSAMVLTDTIDTTNREKYRPAFHHTPLYGWMNDPNGMFYNNGRWHLYYQWNPYGSKWQNMTWGHSSSADMVNWEHHPAAIEPDGLGAIFSGSAVVDSANTAGFGKDAVVAMYTSAAASQVQSLAHSADGGLTFEKYPGNPVLTLDSEARDPKVFFNPHTGRWNMILAHALEHEMLIFSSENLKEWTLESSFGKGEGAQEGVWECPDLFEVALPDGSGSKWVLVSNLNPGGPFGGSAVQYFVGDFDGKTFTADRDADGKIPTRWLDYGKDNYAMVSWSGAPDGRHPLLGWMSNWQYAAEVPTMQFRSANTLPRDITLFEGTDGMLHAATPPAPEVDALRLKPSVSVGSASVGSKGHTWKLPVANDGICEIALTLEPGKASKVTLTLANAKGERVDMVYDVKAATLSMDRNNSGLTDFSRDFPAVTVAPTFAAEGAPLELRIFVDRSSIEAFANGGRSVMTNLVFPTEPYSTLAISATDGQARVSDLRIYPLPSNL